MKFFTFGDIKKNSVDLGGFCYIDENDLLKQLHEFYSKIGYNHSITIDGNFVKCDNLICGFVHSHEIKIKIK